MFAWSLYRSIVRAEGRSETVIFDKNGIRPVPDDNVKIVLRSWRWGRFMIRVWEHYRNHGKMYDVLVEIPDDEGSSPMVQRFTLKTFDNEEDAEKLQIQILDLIN
uniref:Uncharacterized protein n=1 Tax=uncultured marine group II/III euryarchaeote KM3_88_H06 TaxID=1456537 RepID=A0A075I039_9EURY|nr:hypothetical protein [uncultured marine group II/III euryarchaeote KM3_88_H06]